MGTQDEDADAAICPSCPLTRGNETRRARHTSFLTTFVSASVGIQRRTAVHDLPYKGPTIQEETSKAVSHVMSPLNAGGGPDIVPWRGRSKGALCTCGVPYFKYSLAKSSEEYVMRKLPQPQRGHGDE